MRAGALAAAACAVALGGAGAGTGKPSMTEENRQVTITGVNLDRVVGGLIVAQGGTDDMLEALLEIGALRPVTGP